MVEIWGFEQRRAQRDNTESTEECRESTERTREHRESAEVHLEEPALRGEGVRPAVVLGSVQEHVGESRVGGWWEAREGEV